MQLSIRLNAQDRTLYAELSPGDESTPLTFLAIKCKLEEVGYKNLSLDPKKIAELLTNGQQEKECSIPLKTLIDAKASVTIAHDKRQAFLTLTPADGGNPLTMAMIKLAITDAGIPEHLVDFDMVNACFHRHSCNNVGIARARLPVKGNDAVFSPLVESETFTRPKIDDQGVADMLNTHEFVLVEAGIPVMRRTPATQGEAGRDVTAKEIQPPPPNDAGFATNLSGIEVSPEDPNLLVAATKGHPVAVSYGVNIDPTLHLDNVDVNSGNITFDGSVEVKGDVAAGMTIDVTGDVFVQGGVDRAAIRAGQSIRVGG